MTTIETLRKLQNNILDELRDLKGELADGYVHGDWRKVDSVMYKIDNLREDLGWKPFGDSHTNHDEEDED